MTNEAARTLDEALERMSYSIEPGRFALLGTPQPPSSDLLQLLQEPWQLTREGGETTFLVPESVLDAIVEALSEPDSAQIERDLVWVRFEAAMDWNVVGFLARVTTALAEAGIPIGAVCGYSRDHLFIGAAYLARTEEVLARLFRRR